MIDQGKHQARGRPQDRAKSGQNDHRAEHAPGGVAGDLRRGSPPGLPEEYRARQVDETGDRERPRESEAGSRERRQGPGSGTSGLRQSRGPEQSQVDQELAGEPVERGQATDRGRGEEEQRRGPRKHLRQPSQRVDLGRPNGSLDGSGRKEEERLENLVIPGMEERASETQGDPIPTAEGTPQKR